jgi:Tol biopolymer transport system component
VRLTATPSAAAFPSVAPKGKRIAFSVRIQDENIWRMDLDRKEPATVVIDSPQTDSTPAISPDGKTLAFRSSRTGQSEVWLSNINGTSLKRLTHSGGAQAGNPDWSPDGHLLAYTAALHSVPHIWIIPREGGAPWRLTNGQDSESVPRWSRDGHSIYYATYASGASEIWRKPINSGPAVQITHTGAISGQESPHAQWLYFTKGELKPGLWRQPLAGGPEEEVAPELPARLWGNWRAEKDGVYFLSFAWERPYTENLYRFDPVTHQTRIVATTPGIPAPFGAGLALSPDRRWVYFVQVDRLGVSLYFAEDLAW